MITIPGYTVDKLLGKGSYSNVFKGVHKETGIDVAIKVLKKDEFNSQLIDREVDILRKLDHPFIQRVFDFMKTDKNCIIISEYLPNGSLLDRINKNGPISETICRQVFCQIVSALDYLHKIHGIVHRDIKLENVLFDRNNNIRIIDFGLSSNKLNSEDFLKTQCGSLPYASPELLRGENYKEEVDIWALGVILFSCLTGKMPFIDNNLQKTITKILCFEPSYPNDISNEVLDLMQKLLEKKPESRITAQQIMEHPWFQQYDMHHEMNCDFGLNSGMRIFPIDEKDVVKILSQHKMNNDVITQCIKEDEPIAYIMIKREEITFLMHASLLIKSRRIIPKPASYQKVDSNRASCAHSISPQMLPYLKRRNTDLAFQNGMQFGNSNNENDSMMPSFALPSKCNIKRRRRGSLML